MPKKLKAIQESLCISDRNGIPECILAVADGDIPVGDIKQFIATVYILDYNKLHLGWYPDELGNNLYLHTCYLLN